MGAWEREGRGVAVDADVDGDGAEQGRERSGVYHLPAVQHTPGDGVCRRCRPRCCLDRTRSRERRACWFASKIDIVVSEVVSVSPSHNGLLRSSASHKRRRDSTCNSADSPVTTDLTTKSAQTGWRERVRPAVMVGSSRHFTRQKHSTVRGTIDPLPKAPANNVLFEPRTVQTRLARPPTNHLPTRRLALAKRRPLIGPWTRKGPCAEHSPSH